MAALAVVGAHLTGQPLNHQLTDRGGVLLEETTTASCYRLFALPTSPPKPGLVRAVDGDAGAGSIEVEIWELDDAALGSFLQGVPSPLCIGTVELADGRTVLGFLCEGAATVGTPDITRSGGWRSHLRTLAPE